MGLQFVGALDNITEPQLAFIRDVLEKRGYSDTKVTVEPVGQAGDNYVADVRRIVVQNESERFTMIAKIAPQLEAARAAINTENLFRNEHIMYTMVLPKYQQLEKQADVPKRNRIRFAECYGSLSEAPHEVILLEDLQVPGFIMWDRFKPLTEDCIKSVLRNFAILHSLSYALQYKEPETYNEYKNKLYDVWVTMDASSEMVFYYTHVENTAITAVEGDHRKRHLKGCISQALSLVAKMSKQVADSKHSVIQQGDSWTNNILFKFQEDSADQSVLIDYQLSKENSPTYDLMYMIFNCSDHETRLEHFNEWIDYYHYELDNALANYGLKANYVYPRDQLDADMKRYARVLFGILVMLTSVTILKPENAKKMKEAAEQSAKDIQNPANENVFSELTKYDDDFIVMFKKRVEGLVDSFVTFGLL